MEKKLSLYVFGDDSGRLDSFVAEKAHISRSFAQKLIEEGHITYNNEENPKASQQVKDGDLIFVTIPEAREPEILEQDIPIDIVYEDEDIIVVNKVRGMVVHPAPGHDDSTLVNALLYHADEIKGVGNEIRPGIVHRLDKDTSGLIVAAKTYPAHQRMVELFKLRKVKKEYLALVHGKPRGREGVINLPVSRDPNDRKKIAVVAGGKPAVTRWKLIKSFKEHALVAAFPETGRTHQIRVHLSYMGCPVVGDPEYAGKKKPPLEIEGQALHSRKIQFQHPITNRPMEFEAPVPNDMQEIIDYLNSAK
ncbi:MAG: RluA family pseudouridine synthase [Vulcanimicrobiota bacterium]